MKYHCIRNFFQPHLVQESFTVFCKRFPLVSLDNSAHIQCARLRTTDSYSLDESDLEQPNKLILLFIVNILPNGPSPIDLKVSFDQSFDSPSSVGQINFGLFVPNSNYTINGETRIVYQPSTISIYSWNNHSSSNLTLLDTVFLYGYKITDVLTICRWNTRLWEVLFDRKTEQDPPYVYFLQINSSNLTFDLINTSNASKVVNPPVPLYTILHCIPYRLGAIEILMITMFCLLCLGAIIILVMMHRKRRGEDDSTNKAVQSTSNDNLSVKSINNVRRRRSVSSSTIQSRNAN